MPVFEKGGGSDLRMWLAPIGENQAIKDVNIDLKTKPCGFLYNGKGDSIYGRVVVTIDGQEHQYKAIIFPNKFAGKPFREEDGSSDPVPF